METPTPPKLAKTGLDTGNMIIPYDTPSRRFIRMPRMTAGNVLTGSSTKVKASSDADLFRMLQADSALAFALVIKRCFALSKYVDHRTKGLYCRS
jgi:hypothetical protein